MQNVVEVACSSPPGSMNATKPAVQTVQATGQDPFDLVLQQASERIVNNKQSERANKGSESKSVDNNRGYDSTVNDKTQFKNEREVDRSNKAERTQKTEKNEKSLESEKTDSDKGIADKKKSTETYSDQTAAVFSVAVPVTTSVEKVNAESETMISEDTGNALTGESLTGNPELGLSGTAIQDKAAVSADHIDAYATTGSSKVTMGANAAETTPPIESQFSSNGEQAVKVSSENTFVENNATAEDAKLKISMDENQDKIAKVGDKVSNELKDVAERVDNSNEVSGKLNVETGSKTRGEEDKVVSQKSQDVGSPASAFEEKTVKTVEVEANLKTAPPDNPNGTTAVTANAAVQTSSQISEPARLAEAPKNEVITQVANQIDQLVKSNRSSIRLQLYPEELGHIDLKIVSTKSGISVTMMTEKASTQQVLKSDMEMLKQNIEQAGIQLSNLNINQGQNSNKQHSFDQRQNFSNNSHPEMNSDNSNQAAGDAMVHLTSSLVDFKA